MMYGVSVNKGASVLEIIRPPNPTISTVRGRNQVGQHIRILEQVWIGILTYATNE